MPEFRKRPVQAERWFPGKNIPGVAQWHWTWKDYIKDVDKNGGGCACFPTGKLTPHLHTSEGSVIVSYGDYIITEYNGKRYPCNADIFQKIWEEI